MPKITPVRHAQLAKVFELDGWEYKRSKGDHDVYVKAGCIRPIVIPRYDAIGVDIITANLRTAGMSRETYFKLLAMC